MPTATADTQTEQETVAFISRSPNQIITRIAEDHIYDARGRKIGTINRAAELRRLRDAGAPQEEIDYYAADWKIEFQHNRFETDNPVLIDYLRTHENFNVDGPSGFWELVAGQKPTVAEQNARIGKASAMGESEELQKIIDEEKAKHNRTDVLVGAEAALAGLRELEGQAAPAGDADQTGDPPSEPDGTD